MKIIYHLYVALFASSLAAQTPAPAPQKDAPLIEIRRVAVSEAGQLVFGVKIQAARSADMDLYTEPAADGPQEQSDDSEDPQPFDLRGSVLFDARTGKEIAALPFLPRQPYFGPANIVTRLKPGGWIQLGVAFPLPPKPPVVEGKPQPYSLELRIPFLKLATQVTLDPQSFAILAQKSVPFDKNASPSP